MVLHGSVRRRGRDGARHPQIVEQVEQFQSAELRPKIGVEKHFHVVAPRDPQRVEGIGRAVMIGQDSARLGGAQELEKHVHLQRTADLPGRRQRRTGMQPLRVEQQAVHVEHDGGHGARQDHGAPLNKWKFNGGRWRKGRMGMR